MKKIAIVIARLGMPGGAEKVAADLAEEFHRYSFTPARSRRFDFYPHRHFAETCMVIEWFVST